MVRADRDTEREAHIDVFEAGRRLRLIYMPPRELPPDVAERLLAKLKECEPE